MWLNTDNVPIRKAGNLTAPPIVHSQDLIPPRRSGGSGNPVSERTISKRQGTIYPLNLLLTPATLDGTIRSLIQKLISVMIPVPILNSYIAKTISVLGVPLYLVRVVILADMRDRDRCLPTQHL